MHWSLLSTRSLGYQEMFGRATIFIAILSGGGTTVNLAIGAALSLVSAALPVGYAARYRQRRAVTTAAVNQPSAGRT
jgi:hypothetical protein